MKKHYIFFLFILFIPISYGLLEYVIFEDFPNSFYINESTITICDENTTLSSIPDTYEGRMGTYRVCATSNIDSGDKLYIRSDWNSEDSTTNQLITGGNENDEIFFIIQLDSPIVLHRNYSNIQIYSNGSGVGDEWGGMCFGFYNSEPKLYNDVTLCTESSSLSLNSYFFTDGDLADVEYTELNMNDELKGIVPKKINYTGWSGEFWENYTTGDRSFDMLIFGTQSIGRVDNFNITLIDATNTLPEINLTTDTDPICYNESEGSGTVSLNIDTYDNEGDTIYYSLERANFGLKTDEYLKFSYDSDEGLTKDYSFYLNSEQDNYCGICTQSANVTCYSNNLFLDPYFYNGSLEFWLNINSDCDGVSTWLYKLNNKYMAFDYYLTYFSTKYDGNSSFRMSLLDTNLNILDQVQINETGDGYIHLWHINETNEVYIGNTTSLSEHGFQWMEFDTTINSNRYILEGYGYTDYYSLYSADAENKPVAYLKIENTGSSDIGFLSFDMEGYEVEFDWTTVKPIEYEYDIETSFYLYVYVTDSEHLSDNEYNYDFLPIPYKVCDGTSGTLTPRTSEEDISCDNPYDCIMDILAYPFQQMLKTVGYEDDAATLLWWFFIISFLGSMIIGFKLTNNIHIVGSLISSSAISLVLSLFVGSAAVIQQISFAIILALAVTGEVMKVF